MPFKDGNKYGNGRPKGSENRLTRKAKYYAEKLMDEMKAIGIEEIAKSGRMSDYVALLKTLLPKDINMNHSGSIDIPPAQIVIDGKVENSDS